MLCTFCGTENRPEHKFCGMCGVRLERRKEQRRARPATGTVKCQACGHVNDSPSTFCGMCGLRVDRRGMERRSTSPADARAAAIANAQLPTPEAPGPYAASPSAASLDVLSPPPEDEMEARRAAEDIFRSQPRPTTIGGPSFLGLGNDQEPVRGDYLLDDDQPSGSGRGLLLLVILALIGGLGYMGYRQGYFSNLQASTAKQRETVLPPLPQATPLASPSDPVAQKAPSTNPAPAPNSPTTSASPAPIPESSSDRPNAGSTQEAEAADPPDPAAANESATSDQSKIAKPAPTVSHAKPGAMLTQAQNYLQGRGVRQDCEQGLVYLKAATEKNDPAAAVQMGALYASGHCVQQDRVMAYRWFNSAHELDPANPWIQTNLDQIWAQMSPQERHQIAR